MKLPSVISDLSEAEKLDLIDALWENLATSSSVLTEQQCEELDKRVARYRQDPSVGIPWEEVRADLFSRQ